MQKTSKNRPKMSNTNVKAKTTMFFDIATENTEKKNFFFGNCQWDSLLHRFCALILFFVKALRQWWRIREAVKRWNVNYGKKLKQWSDEAFNAGKEIEAMKGLTLSRFCCPALPIRHDLTSVNDTGKECITGINDTGEVMHCGCRWYLWSAFRYRYRY